MKPDTKTCVQCGTELAASTLDGLCPACIARVAFGPEAQAVAPVVEEQPVSGAFGDYELLGEIARGGMGVVFRARHLKLNRIVALKMIRIGLLAAPIELQRFRKEAEAAAHLQHPNIVTIHEVGEHNGLPYFAMEYVEGETLAQVVRAGPLPPERAAGYLRTIAQAIQYAHDKGVLHRDLKPSNVLIDRFDEPRITDFGLAKRLSADAESAAEKTQLTVTGEFLGTPGFASPEQAAGKTGTTSPRSDTFSLGAILYFLLTSRPPFSGHTIADTLSAVLHLPPVPPRTLNARVPRDLETICLKCLEKEPSRRYATAGELADDLGRFLNDEPIVARPVGFAERSWRWCRRHSEMTSLGVSLIIVLGAIGIVLLRAKESWLPSNGRPAQPATRPSFRYTGSPADLIALDEDTLVQTHLGIGMGIAVDPVNNHIWCPLLVSNAVIVRDGISGAVVTNLILADCPGAAAFDPKRRLVWITAQCGVSSDTNYPSNDLLWAIKADRYVPIAGPLYSGGVNGGPEVVNPLTGRFYHDVNGAQRFDTRTFIAANMPYGTVRAVHPTANLLYAAGPGNTLQILDGAPDPETVITNATLPFAAARVYVAVDPVRDEIYAGSPDSDKIAVMDARTGKMKKTIVLDGGIVVSGVQGIAIDPVRNRIFALAITAPVQHVYLFAIQGTDQRAVALPGYVGGPVVNPAINKVYVWIEYVPEDAGR